MNSGKLVWEESERQAKAAYHIDNVGQVSVEVMADLLHPSSQLSIEERRALIRRYARLLVRNLAKELERE